MISALSQRLPTCATLMLAAILLAACGSGGGSGSDGYTIGGNVTGLAAGQSVVLKDTVSGQSATLSANGSYIAITNAAANVSYNLSVLTQPNGQNCSLSNASGSVGTANVSNVDVRCVNLLNLLAGGIGGAGNLDGIGVAARFSRPNGMAFDRAGNLYVADSNNHAIRKITPAGVVSVWAGAAGVQGVADGDCVKARFLYLQDITVDSVGNVYVADLYNHTIRKITPACTVSTLAGQAGVRGTVDGTGAAARFAGPSGVILDTAGNLYVTDTFNGTIRKITPAGAVSTLAGTAGLSGSTDGTGAAARFSSPVGITIDSTNNLYVGDIGNSTVRKITPAGVVSTFAGTAGARGSTDGTGSAARFSYPSGISADGAGNLYVADSLNNTIRKITSAGVVSTLAGTTGVYGAADGMAAVARFRFPTATKMDSAGNLWVADSDNHTLRKITPAGVVSTVAGMAIAPGSTDGIGAAARFDTPNGMAGDSAGNVYVADSSNNTIRKITADGAVSTLAGTVRASGSTDGAGTAARFNNPFGITVDSAGNLYLADSFNRTIRKITPAGVVSTLAGMAGVDGAADGVGATASFSSPVGIAIDNAANLYVVDQSSNTIRKITPAGVVSTLAGTAVTQGAADGVGSAASFNFPTGIALDSAGNVYVADTSNHTIRKITAAGVVSTLAGMAGVRGSTDGTGAAARFNFPNGLTADSAGNLYVADSNNYTVRKITPAGVVSTVMGRTGQAGLVLGPQPTTLGVDVGWVSAIGNKLFIATENSVVWSYLP
jgi:sugar lactone lactonase YvrE